MLRLVQENFMSQEAAQATEAAVIASKQLVRAALLNRVIQAIYGKGPANTR